jgi:hypothetical protein
MRLRYPVEYSSHQCGPLLLLRLPTESDPLNTPEDLREDDRTSARTEASVFIPSRNNSRHSMKRQTSLDIMRSLPDKLRSHVEHAQYLADNALNSFIIINSALQRSAALADYVQRPDVKQRMGVDFRVGMGFGLHAGCEPASHIRGLADTEAN